jgi:hypothetical protein
MIRRPGLKAKTKWSARLLTNLLMYPSSSRLANCGTEKLKGAASQTICNGPQLSRGLLRLGLKVIASDLFRPPVA